MDKTEHANFKKTPADNKKERKKITFKTYTRSWDSNLCLESETSSKWL